MKNTNFLAGMFVWIREVIESAETPFVKFAIFVLPVLSPVVPASVTGIRLNTELNFHPFLCIMTALVLEMLGYVGAITFIRSIYKWFQRRGSFLSLLLGGASYGFYVFAMYSINVRLGTLAGDDPIVSSVFAILSFLTIPTGLLAAEHINERTEQEEEYTIRQESRQDRMERYRIKNSYQESYQKVTKEPETPEKVSSNLPTDWRKIRPTLDESQVYFLATSEPKIIVQELAKSKINVSPRTASNWKANAMKELGIKKE
jgi:hypothetical protein